MQPYLMGNHSLFDDKFSGGPGFYVCEEVPDLGKRSGIAGPRLLTYKVRFVTADCRIAWILPDLTISGGYFSLALCFSHRIAILSKGGSMAYTGKIQLTVIFTATPDLVGEGDRIFKSHAAWMAKSHYRDGNKALLLYNIVKGPELANPLDPSSAPTGNTCFVLSEVYESRAGVDDHWKQGAEGWQDFPALAAWGSKCRPTTLHGASVVHSLW